MKGVRAADDFEAIRLRLEELRRERHTPARQSRSGRYASRMPWPTCRTVSSGGFLPRDAARQHASNRWQG